MTIPLRLANHAAQPVRDAMLPRYSLPTEELSGSQRRLEPSTPELAFRIFSAFRAHPHINNVLTHISHAKWREVEQALNRIFDLSTTSDGLSPLEENIVELMVGERGITGKILKPYFQAALRRMIEPSPAERLIRHVTALYLELECKVQHPTPAPVRSEPAENPDVEPNPNERVIHAADIDPHYRHTILARLFEHLAPDQSLQIVVDHDPRRLRLQLEATHGSRCAWSYLEKGPDVWRIRLRLLPDRSPEHA